MDQNASQSILMVGGMLLAISVLSFFVYAIATFGGFASNMNSQIEGSEIQKYNQHFLKFEGRYNIVFQDVISTINFAKDWNDQNDYSFKQVAGSSTEKGPYSINVYVKDAEGNTHQIFGSTPDSWINEDSFKDNQKVKNILNEKLNDAKYADYYYAVSMKTITSSSEEPAKNYYVLSGDYGGAPTSGRNKDVVFNSKTGFIEEIYFTAVTKTNFAQFPKNFYVKNQKGERVKIEYKIQNKDYFKMTEIED